MKIYVFPDYSWYYEDELPEAIGDDFIALNDDGEYDENKTPMAVVRYIERTQPDVVYCPFDHP